MRFFTLRAILAAALFSVVVALPFLPVTNSQTTFFRLEISATSTAYGYAQLFFDIGRGYREEDSAKATVESSPSARILSFALPSATYRSLRLDPLERGGTTMTLADARIVDSTGKVMKRFTAADFQVEQNVSPLLTQPDGAVRVEIPATSVDPILRVALAEPITLKPTTGQQVGPPGRIVLGIFGGVLVLLFAAGRVGEATRRTLRERVERLATRPGRALALVAAVAVVASAYPVVFLGKSYVSPNYEPQLLYDVFPTLPGYRDTRREDMKGSDMGAIIWQQVPMARIQQRALFHDFELPLWNRYNSAGTSLLGQGQSMFGDPVHFIVIFANSAAWAWDLKYLIAKWLLALGVALCIWRATRHLPSAAIVAAVMPFIGYFIHRFNHPAFFSTCYGPWILLCWLGIVQATGWRRVAAWVGGLIIANWTVMNSGSVKEAYMVLLTLNFAGAVMLLVAALPVWERARRFAISAAGGAIFLLLAAPVWITLFDALGQSYSSYNNPHAHQVQPSLALAFFDEILFRPYWEGNHVFNGSVNFIVLLGFLSFLVNLRRLWTDRIVLGLTLASLLPLVLIFAVIPPEWIIQIPFLANVAHIDNSFFCPSITLLGVLAGFGFRSAAERLGTSEGRGDLVLGFGMLALLTGMYLGFGQAVHRSTVTVWRLHEHFATTPFITWNLVALLVSALVLALVVRGILIRRAAGPASVLLLVTCAAVMLWRFGLQVPTSFGDFVTAPAVRASFSAKSPALATAREDQQGDAWRFVGINGSAFHGWMNMYAFEGVGGADALMNLHYRELQEGLGLERIWDWRLYTQYPTLPTQRKAYDFLNVRHYFDYKSDQGIMGALFTLVKTGDLDVYRSETAWPRAFFTDRIAVYDDPKALGKLVNEGDGRPFAAMQRSDNQRPGVPLPNLDGRAIVPATNYHLTTNKTAFDIEASGPGMVVLQEAWLKRDFIARVDGKRVPYLRVNHAFKGIYLERGGKHRVEFEYWPRRFTASLVMCGVGVLALLGAIGFIRRRPANA